MKKLIFLMILMVLPLRAISQTNYNQISNSNYGNIEFSGVKLSTLKNFQGDVHSFSQLLNSTFSQTCNDSEGEAKVFENSNFEFSYFGYPPNMQLYSIVVKTNNIQVTINNINLHIGDNLATLGYGTLVF